MSLSKTVTVRVTPAQLSRIRDSAKSRDTTMSALVRVLLDRPVCESGERIDQQNKFDQE